MSVLDLTRDACAKLLPAPVKARTFPPRKGWTTERLEVIFGVPPCEPWLIFEDSGGVMAIQASGQQIFLGLELGVDRAISELVTTMRESVPEDQ